VLVVPQLTIESATCHNHCNTTPSAVLCSTSLQDVAKVFFAVFFQQWLGILMQKIYGFIPRYEQWKNMQNFTFRFQTVARKTAVNFGVTFWHTLYTSGCRQRVFIPSLSEPHNSLLAANCRSSFSRMRCWLSSSSSSFFLLSTNVVRAASRSSVADVNITATMWHCTVAFCSISLQVNITKRYHLYSK